MADPRRAACARALSVLFSLGAGVGAAVECHARASMAVASSQAEGGATRVDQDRLLADVRVLSAPGMEGRLAGTPGARRAGAYIRERFRELGLVPLADSYEQKFPIQDAGDGAAGQPAVGTTIMGMIAGRGQPGRLVIVSAHYDHLGTRNGRVYPGADDNASGVAAMLAVAGWFAGRPPGASLLFLAFDAEEQGLRGARYFVRHPPIDLERVTAIVNLDMVGRGDTNRLVVAGTSYTPWLKPIVAEAARGRELTIAFGYDRPAGGERRGQDWTHASDHGPFHDAGVPFLYFGVENHEDYHKPTDTAERIPRRFFTEMTEVVLETVRRLAEGE